MAEVKTVLVVGAGTMGSAIAQVFAASGFKTTMADIKQEFIDGAFDRIDKNIESMKENELVTGDDYAKTVKANLKGILNSDIPAQAKDFDLVVEVVPENPDIKKDTYQMLSDSCREDTIFCSNTSGMDVFTLTKDFLKNPSRLIITHWFNPPYIMKLIEVVQGPETSDETAETVRETLIKCGKKPAVLKKFMPGFIVNRLATLICRELYYMIEQGWVTAQDAEDALMYTDGLRWSFEGPIALWDFVGLEIPLAVAEGVVPTLCTDVDRFPLKDKIFAEGRLGVKAGKGVLRDYPEDFDEFIAKRNKKIIKMYKTMEELEQM